jgi:hypothetical protein
MALVKSSSNEAKKFSMFGSHILAPAIFYIPETDIALHIYSPRFLSV